MLVNLPEDLLIVLIKFVSDQINSLVLTDCKSELDPLFKIYSALIEAYKAGEK